MQLYVKPTEHQIWHMGDEIKTVQEEKKKFPTIVFCDLVHQKMKTYTTRMTFVLSSRK